MRLRQEGARVERPGFRLAAPRFAGLRGLSGENRLPEAPAKDVSRRRMFDGLRLSRGPAAGEDALADDRALSRAVEHMARSVQAISQAQEKGEPILGPESCFRADA